MLVPVLLIVGLAAGATVAERTQILLLDLEASVPKETIQLLGGSIASAVAKYDNVEVITTADLRAMTELESSKAAAGCDQTSCLAELAAALGARYVMYGRLGPLGGELILQLNLFDANATRAVARTERRAPDLAALSAEIPAAVDELLAPINVVAEPSPLFVTASVLAVAGSVVALGAGVGAASLEASLWSAASSVDDKQRALDVGPWLWGTALVAAAAGTVGTTILFLPVFEGAP